MNKRVSLPTTLSSIGPKGREANDVRTHTCTCVCVHLERLCLGLISRVYLEYETLLNPLSTSDSRWTRLQTCLRKLVSLTSFGFLFSFLRHTYNNIFKREGRIEPHQSTTKVGYPRDIREDDYDLFVSELSEQVC